MTTPELIAKLRAEIEVAKRATGGGYLLQRRDNDCGSIDWIVYSDAKSDIAYCTEMVDHNAKQNAAHIAQCSPDHYITRLEVLIECLEALEKAARHPVSHYEDCASMGDEDVVECDCGVGPDFRAVDDTLHRASERLGVKT